MVVFGTVVLVCITGFWVNLFAAAGPKASSRVGRNLVSLHGADVSFIEGETLSERCIYVYFFLVAT